MTEEIWQTLLAWVLAALLYPGVLFGLALALVGEWLYAAVRPAFIPRLYRVAGRAYHPFGPISNFTRLLGRREPGSLSLRSIAGRSFGAAISPAGAAGLVSALAPLVALALMPFPGNPITREIGTVGDLLTILALLALGPAARALSRAAGGTREAAGLAPAREIGRLATALLPVAAAAAALVEASGAGSVQLSQLSAAPETGVQFAVRALAGAALLLSLPWWSSATASEESAATYVGILFQRAAAAALWSLLVLPVPGEFSWAVVVTVGGAVVAYAAMRLLRERWAPAMRDSDAAGRAWAASMPVAAVAVLLALWLGA